MTVGLLVLVARRSASASAASRRWLDLGPFRFQPSEFGKLLLVLVLAGFLADRGQARQERRTTLIGDRRSQRCRCCSSSCSPTSARRSSTGPASARCLFAAGTRWSHLAVLAVAHRRRGSAVLWVAARGRRPPAQAVPGERLTGFTHPSQDPSGATYNISQSLTAVGAGGFHGRGVAGATQTSLDYLPEHDTDFAFASLAEQRGFVGASILLLLYLLVVWRGLKMITVARDAFGAIAAGGIVVALLFQIFVNVGMTIGIAPITGIPLPFVSVGGSSMIANLLAIGVLQRRSPSGRQRCSRSGPKHFESRCHPPKPGLARREARKLRKRSNQDPMGRLPRHTNRAAARRGHTGEPGCSPVKASEAKRGSVRSEDLASSRN